MKLSENPLFEEVPPGTPAAPQEWYDLDTGKWYREKGRAAPERIIDLPTT